MNKSIVVVMYRWSINGYINGGDDDIFVYRCSFDCDIDGWWLRSLQILKILIMYKFILNVMWFQSEITIAIYLIRLDIWEYK